LENIFQQSAFLGKYFPVKASFSHRLSRTIPFQEFNGRFQDVFADRFHGCKIGNFGKKGLPDWEDFDVF